MRVTVIGETSQARLSYLLWYIDISVSGFNSELTVIAGSQFFLGQKWFWIILWSSTVKVLVWRRIVMCTLFRQALLFARSWRLHSGCPSLSHLAPWVVDVHSLYLYLWLSWRVRRAESLECRDSSWMSSELIGTNHRCAYWLYCEILGDGGFHGFLVEEWLDRHHHCLELTLGELARLGTSKTVEGIEESFSIRLLRRLRW